MAQAFNWQEKVGRGLENIILNAGGSHDGNNELRIFLVVCWVTGGGVEFSCLVRSIMAS